MSKETGVPGSGNGIGRSKGASGNLMPGGKKLHGGGTNFDSTSAHNQGSDRVDHGKKASVLRDETLTAQKRS